MTMIVWALTDDRTGGNNQTKAVAEKISKNYLTKKIVYNSFIKLPNFIRRSSLIGVNLKASDDIKNNLPDVVICAGRRLSSVALNIKKRSNGETFVVNLMDPNMGMDAFDVVVLPKHDNASKRILSKKNVFETHGSVGLVNSEKVEVETKKWKDFFKKAKKPLISLIIGGDTKEYKFDPKKFGEMVKKLSEITKKLSGTLLITTSRRTSDACLIELKNKIDCDNYIYDWRAENDEKNTKKNPLGNPYFAFMGLSDFLVVTGDSMSMVSESCSTGKPVYVYMPRESLGKKHRRFCDSMIKDKYVKEFGSNTKKLEKYSYKPLNEAERIGNVINKKLKNKKGKK